MKKKQCFRKKRQSFSLALLFICAFVLTVLCFLFFEKRMLPPLQEISHTRSKNLANQAIDGAILKVMERTGVSASSFLISEGEDGQGYRANTALINLFCSELNKEINISLEALPKEVIRIPLGAASNSNFFANMGPEIPFILMPAGEVTADYETSFVAAGINQVNYKIWILVSLNVQIVNPLYKEKVSLNRKIMLVDALIGGKVPDHYFSMDNGKNIY